MLSPYWVCFSEKKICTLDSLYCISRFIGKLLYLLLLVLIIIIIITGSSTQTVYVRTLGRCGYNSACKRAIQIRISIYSIVMILKRNFSECHKDSLFIFLLIFIKTKYLAASIACSQLLHSCSVSAFSSYIREFSFR